MKIYLPGCQIRMNRSKMADDDLKERIIAAVQPYQFLYDMKHNDYKDLIKKENAWQAVAFQCCSDGKLQFIQMYFNI